MGRDEDLSTVAAPPVTADCRLAVSQSRSQKAKPVVVSSEQALSTEPPAVEAPAPIDPEKKLDSHTSERGPHSF